MIDEVVGIGTAKFRTSPLKLRYHVIMLNSQTSKLNFVDAFFPFYHHPPSKGIDMCSSMPISSTLIVGRDSTPNMLFFLSRYWQGVTVNSAPTRMIAGSGRTDSFRFIMIIMLLSISYIRAGHSFSPSIQENHIGPL